MKTNLKAESLPSIQLTLEQVMNEHADLGANGFRTQSETDEMHEKFRAELAGDAGGELDAALRFLENVVTRKTMAPGRSSYGLKHVAEKHQYGYISNGTLIAAMLMVGVPVRQHSGSPNCEVGISVPWIKERERVAQQRYPNQYDPPATWPFPIPGTPPQAAKGTQA